MKSTKKIYCSECQKSIDHIDDLVVARKLLQPYHVHCFMNPEKVAGKINKFNGSFPRGKRFWFWLILGNIISGIICTIETNSLFVFYLFIVLCNIVFISARIGIYYTYERHLT